MRIVKWVLFTWPIVLLIGLSVYSAAARSRLDARLVDPNKVIWGAGDAQAVVKIVETGGVELTTNHVTVVTTGGDSLFDDVFAIDRDMWGGGFIAGVQADDDPPLEIVAWGRREQKTSFILDYANGIVTRKSFSDGASEDVLAVTRDWSRGNVEYGVLFTVCTMGTVAYYVVLLPVCLVVWIVRKIRRRSAAGKT